MAVLFAALLAWLPLAASANPAPEHAAATMAADETSFAVVELFTSQGCSSCPGAEQALARLGEQTGGLAVFPIEWHVDYWDYLGWPDPYALPEAAQRQRRYGRALSSRIFTPQLIVNGREVVRPAQDYTRVHSAAVAALGPPASTAAGQPALLLTAPVHSDRSVQIDYRVTDLPAGCVLTVVAVETGLENFVPRGENTGRTLHHHNVVRGFATVDLGSAADESGRVRITLPHGVVRSASSIVGYVQQHNTLHIVAAARATPASPGASS
jgi:hypothetical protein